MEGEALAAGVGHCVAWPPGGPQQLLVLQPHAVVQPHSVRLHFRHGHKDALGYLSFSLAGLKLLELETQVIHIDLGCDKFIPTQNGCSQTATQNSSQSMRVWPGLRLIGTPPSPPPVQLLRAAPQLQVQCVLDTRRTALPSFAAWPHWSGPGVFPAGGPPRSTSVWGARAPCCPATA